MKYSIDYPDHELSQFVGQTLVRRHPLHRVYCATITIVEKVYNDEGKPSELIFTFVDGDNLVLEEHSPKLNNPDYTINGKIIGVKPNKTQHALIKNLMKKAQIN